MNFDLEMVQLIKGSKFIDNRGLLLFNNNFDLISIRRSYIIENLHLKIRRGWKGHLVEKRWFLCTKGSITIFVAKIDDLNSGISRNLSFKLDDSEMSILYVPEGNATLIKQELDQSRIMVFSDYILGESNDEDLRWENNIFST